jgi:AcrR family transcriptional regulator
MKPLRSQATRDRIFVEARRLFGEVGYERTTIRAVAAAAGIHPSMVMRYYANKEGLFAAAASFDLALPELGDVRINDVGKTLIRHFLRRWAAEGDDLPALLRVAVTHEEGRARLFALFREQVVPVVAKLCGARRAESCAALLATQTIGLAFTRYVLKMPSVVDLPDDVIIERLGATVQSCLTEKPTVRRAKR